ncbi:hypothetical protein [Desulfitobacterium sp.]|uniref:hypothetical protein n=1 Tax=Desulfitobacterium sp. TaxID=49981 RepID=UPI002BA6915B|nr:hypothetical protein [Desulfitobacterium sp.]HVJ48517.1 hypothetical protein [Desulfitobacterium sp.]
MLKHPIINKDYIDKLQEIRYLGEVQENELARNSEQDKSMIINHGHCMQILTLNDCNLNSLSAEYEVIGWIERTEEIPYDFILHDPVQQKHYIALLHGRTDDWPLFSVQPEGYTCARSKMGSDWNCRLCVKYFGTVCIGR